MAYIVEKFHARNNRFGRPLTLEFHFTLNDEDVVFPGHEETRGRKDYENSKSNLVKIVASLAEPRCTRGPPLQATTKRVCLLKTSEVVGEVFGFLVRDHLEVCRLVCGGWKKLVDDGANVLALHHLKCSSEDVTTTADNARSWPPRELPEVLAWCLEIIRFREDLPFNDARRFKFTSQTPREYTRALIRRHLRNCYVEKLECDYIEWSILSELENCSIGRLCADIGRGDLARILPTVQNVLVKRKVRKWTTSLKLPVERQDLFHWPMLLQLEQMKIHLFDGVSEPRMHLFWTNALFMLPNCNKLEVSYGVGDAADFRPICQALAFESGEISSLVDRFVFEPRSMLEFPFDAKNLAYAELHTPRRWLEGQYVWDVYHYRNARTKTWMTAFVGQCAQWPFTKFRMEKGKLEPSESFLFT
ncbi:hypothetical protein AAVH_18740 [Aphelenchoides avenae]|nr:hypothetical protein AAVH_18740 [Aphelenchus avenae]